MKLIFFILGYFLPFYPPPPLTCQKNENFNKMKKTPGDIIILLKCNKNHDHMQCCPWDMACDRCNYFSFWASFCPFTALTAQKIKISKNEKKKKKLEITSFYTCVTKIIIRWCTVPEKWCTIGAQTDRQIDKKSDT